VVDGAETVADVGVQHPLGAAVGLDPDGLKGLMGRALRAEPEADRQEVGLEDRLQDQLRCGHRHPVTHGRDAKRPGLARLARLGDVHPPQRRRPVATGPKRCREVTEEGCHPGRLDLINGHAIHAGRPSVGSHLLPGPPPDIAAGNLVVESMEPAVGLLLGAAVQHALQGTDLVQAVGPRGGPSPQAGTHRIPPPARCLDEAGVLPSGRVVLSRAVKRYYDPLRLPGGRPPLPGDRRL
jgi:hypothetical protein